MRTVAFCEIDPYCRAVLRKHWPSVPCFEDVRDLHAYDVGPVDVIAGGFPCQDISFAGKGAGIAGSRSGLWSEYRRLIEECRPSWVIAENVSALRSRGLDQVLGELAALGYDAEWHCIPAAAVGAPHRRDRVWIVAYPGGLKLRVEPRRRSGESGAGEALAAVDGQARNVADADQIGSHGAGACGAGRNQSQDGRGDVADAYKPRLEGRLSEILRECASERPAWQGGPSISDAHREGKHAIAVDAEVGRTQESGAGVWWGIEPDVGRVANGVPSRVDRLRALGNAVVPQIPEIIGRAIMSYELCSGDVGIANG